MSDAAAWDARYGSGDFAFGEEPNRYLEALGHRLRPGLRALCLGDGEGRNGVWLAARGLDVTSADWSPVGVAKARALAARRGVALRAEVADLVAWEGWPVGACDLVAWVFVHLPPADREAVAARAVAALAPGGWLLLEGFSPAQGGRRSGGPRDRDLLWTGDEARRLFGALVLEECLEGTVRLDEGPRHRGEAEVVRGLWRRSG